MDIHLSNNPENSFASFELNGVELDRNGAVEAKTDSSTERNADIRVTSPDIGRGL